MIGREGESKRKRETGPRADSVSMQRTESLGSRDEGLRDEVSSGWAGGEAASIQRKCQSQWSA